ncbi:hypothetical protein FOA52_001773 [Chlamydomonas sp. UWO 241]|nr:hypothetical protein FOA52_001773 [Chlamydomonas sp. UWO 241]
MTVGQFLECVVAKSLATRGVLRTFTPFDDADLAEWKHDTADEVMYNGDTGEAMPCDIFVGPTYYYRLKHMSGDKISYRNSHGRRIRMTRQPPQGRSNDGGLRIGEMEANVLLAHGLGTFTKETMLDRSDGVTAFADGRGFLVSRPTDGGRPATRIEIPHCATLLAQELATMSIRTAFVPHVRFDITSITSDSVIVFIGKRRTGKSFMVKDLLYFHRDIPIGTVISGTESASPFYCNIMPSVFIHDEYSPQLLDRAVSRQKKIRSMMERKKIDTIDSRALCLLDDCLYDPSWIKDKNIRCLFMNGRHYNVLFMITMQYPLGIPPALRTNIDFVFILRENNMNNRKRLYANYASMFPTFDMFCQVMDKCTENYECLVVKNNVNSNKLEDQVFWYKAEDRGSFKIGSEEFWKASRVRDAASKAAESEANDFDEDEMNAFDATAFRTKQTIRVTKKI